MPERAIWKGVITFGIVTVPVKLYTAIRTERTQFHLLHDQDNVRLQQQMVCPVENAPVERDHMVKGYEVSEEEYVLINDEEVESLAPEGGRDVEVSSFVDPGAVDPRFFDRAYYLGPDGEPGRYALLHQAIENSGKIGICHWVMRKRSYVGALRISGELLVLVTLHPGAEVVPVQEMEKAEAKLDKRELQMAKYLIDTLASDFEPQRYHDEYEVKLKDLVRRKAKGEKVALPKPQRPEVTASGKLLATLEASVKQAKERQAHASAAR